MEAAAPEKPSAPKAVRILIKVAIFFWPLLFLLSHRNIVFTFTVMALACALITAVRASLYSAFNSSKDAVFLSALSFGFYVSLSTFWAPDKSYFTDGIGLLLLILNSYLLLSATRILGPRIRDRYFGFGLLAIFLLGIEAMTGGFFRDITPPESDPVKDIISAGRGLTLSIFLTPAILFILIRGIGAAGLLSLHGRAVICLITFIALFWGAIRFEVAANMLALLAMLGAGLLAWRWPKGTLNLIFAGFFLLLLLMPFIIVTIPSLETLFDSTFIPASWRMRLAIWHYTSVEILSQPIAFLFGHGVNAAKSLTELSPHLILNGAPPDARLLPTHPHNLFLHLWFEYGFTGVLLFGWALWTARSVLLKFAGTMPLLPSAVAGLLAITGVYAMVEMSLWTQWRLVGVVLGVWGLYLAITRGGFCDR